ncbi:MAG: VWA domain-containing protein, partial [Acidobacteriota bacterium]
MTRTSLRALTLLTCLLLATPVIRGGQSPADSQATEHTPKFRVGVDIVRIDAGVTDRDGRTVPNLTAADFEVRQDGKLQTVTYAQFMPVSSAPAAEAVVAVSGSPAAAPAPASAIPVVQPEEIQRTLAIVVDDLGLSFESFHGMQRALHDFIDHSLAPTDLVAVVRTGGAGGGLQPFTTDRRVLHAAIDELRWNGRSRNGVEPFTAVNSWTTFSGGGPAPGSPGAAAPGSGAGEATIDPADFRAVDQLRSSMSAAGTLGALNLVIRGTRELPGRKAVILVTEGFQMLDRLDAALPESRTRTALDRVTEQATRAGVVIYTLDARGLQTGGLLASDNIKNRAGEGIRDFSADRTTFRRDTQEGMAYLAEQTGGFAV